MMSNEQTNRMHLVLGPDASMNEWRLYLALEAVQRVGGGEVTLSPGTHPITLRGELRMIRSDGDFEGSFSIDEAGGLIGPNTHEPVSFLSAIVRAIDEKAAP